jgi:type III secretion protein L
MSAPGGEGNPVQSVGASVAIDRQRLAAAEGPIIPREQFSAMLNAQELVAEAGRHAQALRAQAESELAAARARGHAQGLEAARSEFAASVVEATARLESAYIGLEARIANTVMDALQRILGEVGEAQRMRSMIARALAAVAHDKPVRLLVAAADFETAQRELAALRHEYPRVDVVELQKSAQAEPGSCVLESEYGRVDASLATQLAAVRMGLIKAFVGRRDGVAPKQGGSA